MNMNSLAGRVTTPVADFDLRRMATFVAAEREKQLRLPNTQLTCHVVTLAEAHEERVGDLAMMLVASMRKLGGKLDEGPLKMAAVCFDYAKYRAYQVGGIAGEDHAVVMDSPLKAFVLEQLRKPASFFDALAEIVLFHNAKPSQLVASKIKRTPEVWAFALVNWLDHVDDFGIIYDLELRRLRLKGKGGDDLRKVLLAVCQERKIIWREIHCLQKDADKVAGGDANFKIILEVAGKMSDAFWHRGNRLLREFLGGGRRLLKIKECRDVFKAFQEKELAKIE